MRQGIHLRGYAQKNPKQEYKREAFELFEMLLENVRNEVTKITFTVQIRRAEDVEETNPAKTYSNINVSYNHSQNDADSESAENAAKNKADNKPKANKKSPSRNDPCPCGSGKKYKHCCGKLK